jgi:hypothetical protein
LFFKTHKDAILEFEEEEKKQEQWVNDTKEFLDSWDKIISQNQRDDQQK